MTPYNGILVLDKPPGCTSHDLVQRLRKTLGERRIGHAGTLDPMATGVLPMFIGRATRGVQYLPGEKTYVAEFALGFTTDTQDCTGQTLTVSEHRPHWAEMLSSLDAFRGEILQTPPMMSAVQIDGVRLYKLARQGIEVAREPRRLHVSELLLTQLDIDEFSLRVTCSQGGYIRTLIHDLGQAWGCGAVMTALRRVRAGPFTESDALTLAQIRDYHDRNELSPFFRPLDSLFTELPALTLPENGEKRIRNGAPVRTRSLAPGRVRVYNLNGDFLCVGLLNEGVLTSERNFF